MLSQVSFFFFPFIFISWRLITLQYCSGFCHTLAWISHGFTCVLPSWTPLLPPSLWVIPVHQPWTVVSCIQPGLAICFTLDNIHVSMLFSQITPPSPSPIESKSLFCTSVLITLYARQAFLSFHSALPATKFLPQHQFLVQDDCWSSSRDNPFPCCWEEKDKDMRSPSHLRRLSGKLHNTISNFSLSST